MWCVYRIQTVGAQITDEDEGADGHKSNLTPVSQAESLDSTSHRNNNRSTNNTHRLATSHFQHEERWDLRFQLIPIIRQTMTKSKNQVRKNLTQPPTVKHCRVHTTVHSVHQGKETYRPVVPPTGQPGHVHLQLYQYLRKPGTRIIRCQKEPTSSIHALNIAQNGLKRH